MKYMVIARAAPEVVRDVFADAQGGSERLRNVMESLQPEAAYFGVTERRSFLVVNAEDPNELRTVLESVFFAIGDTPEIVPVTDAEALSEFMTSFRPPT